MHGSSTRNVCETKLSRQLILILREGITSTYDNLLIFYANNVNEYSGEYGCTVRNALGSSSEVTTIRGKHAEVFVI